jgi:hypothetical protein
MLSSTAQRLYDYTRSTAAGIASAETSLYSFLKNLYLETGDKQNLPRLVYNGDYPIRFAQAYDDYLDLIGRGFGIFRGPNETNEAFRQKIKLAIIKNPTVSGIENSIATVFSGLGFQVKVTVTPAIENFFDGVASNLDTPMRGRTGSRLFRLDISIFPGVRVEYPNFLYEVDKNTEFSIPASGVYKFYLNPFNQNPEDLGEVTVLIKNNQFPARAPSVVFSTFAPQNNTIIDLGFLTDVLSIDFNVTSASNPSQNLSSSENYIGYLTLNDSKFDFYRNPEYNTLILNFGVDFLREIFSEVSSFGIIIERIAVKNAGTGG